MVAEDAEGARGVARTSVTVVPVNAPPVADAGADQAVETGSVVALSGAGTDADGAVALTEWTQLSGEAVVLSDTSTLSPTFTSPSVASTVVLELRVTDDEGAFDTDVVEIAVSAPSNLSPVADAGLDQAVVEGPRVPLPEVEARALERQGHRPCQPPAVRARGDGHSAAAARSRLGQVCGQDPSRAESRAADGARRGAREAAGGRRPPRGPPVAGR